MPQVIFTATNEPHTRKIVGSLNLDSNKEGPPLMERLLAFVGRSQIGDECFYGPFFDTLTLERPESPRKFVIDLSTYNFELLRSYLSFVVEGLSPTAREVALLLQGLLTHTAEFPTLQNVATAIKAGTTFDVRLVP